VPASFFARVFGFVRTFVPNSNQMRLDCPRKRESAWLDMLPINPIGQSTDMPGLKRRRG
jgi:hypothetical protein